MVRASPRGKVCAFTRFSHLGARYRRVKLINTVRKRDMIEPTFTLMRIYVHACLGVFTHNIRRLVAYAPRNRFTTYSDRTLNP